MYRFIRTATVKNAALTPSAMGFATELTGWINKTFETNLVVGLEHFGGLRIHWHMDVPNLQTVEEINTRLTNDKDYWNWLERGKEFWVEGSLHDFIVRIDI